MFKQKKKKCFLQKKFCVKICVKIKNEANLLPDLKSFWFYSSAVKIQKDSSSRNIQRQLLNLPWASLYLYLYSETTIYQISTELLCCDINLSPFKEIFIKIFREIFIEIFRTAIYQISTELLCYDINLFPFLIRYLAWLNINSVYYIQLAEKSATWIKYSRKANMST